MAGSTGAGWSGLWSRLMGLRGLWKSRRVFLESVPQTHNKTVANTGSADDISGTTGLGASSSALCRVGHGGRRLCCGSHVTK